MQPRGRQILRRGDRNKMKKLSVLFLLLILTSVVQAESFVWQKIPLKSSLQATMGQAGGEGHQMPYDIKVAPSNASIIYFVTDTEGVWKSTDGGESWNPKWHSGFKCLGGNSIGIHPTNPDLVLVAVSPMIGSISPQSGGISGISRSTDGGDTWTLATGTAYVTGNYATVYYTKNSPSSPYAPFTKGNDEFAFIPGSTTVYAGTYFQGLLISQDSGATWSVANSYSSLGSIFDIQVHPTASPTKLYLCTSNGVYSKSGTGTPTLITTGLPSRPLQMVIDYVDPNYMYFVCESSGIYRSTTGGTSCLAINSGMSAALSYGNIAYCLEIDKVNRNKLYVSWKPNPSNYTVYDNYYTTNNATAGTPTWYKPSSLDYYDSDGVVESISGYVVLSGYANPIASVPGASGTVFFFTGTENPIKSTDGGLNWTYKGNGYLGAAAYANCKSFMSYSPNTTKTGTATYALGIFDFGVSIGNGSTWASVTKAGGYYACRAIALEPGTTTARLCASWGNSGSVSRLYYSDNYGTTWTAATANDGCTVNSTTIAFHKNLFWKAIPGTTTPSSVVYTRNMRSTDRGKSWKWLTTAGDSTPIITDVYHKNPNYICSFSSGVIHSAADATTYVGTDLFTRRNVSIASSGLRDVCFSANNPNRMYALESTSSTAACWIIDYASTGSTALKIPISGFVDGKGEIDYMNIISDPQVTAGNDDILYIVGNRNWTKCQSSGLLRSVDSGHTWESITSSSNINGAQLYSAIVNPLTRWIQIGGACGNWKLPPPGLASEDITDHANQVQAKLTLDAMTVDGLGNESAWASANSITLNKVISGSTDLTGSVTAKVLYDATGFYVLVNINDLNLHKDSADSSSYNDSSAEIYIDGNNNNSIPVLEAGSDRLVRVGWNRNISQIQFLPVAGTTTGILYGSSTTATGYKEEWFVPFANIGYAGTSTLPVSPNLSLPFIGFDVFYNEDDNGGTRDAVIGWSGTDTNYLDTSEYGDLVFSTSTAGGAASPPTVTTGTASAIGISTGTLNGTITANNATTDAWFKYGTVSGNLNLTTATSQFTGSTPGALSKTITGLTQNTMYYYQAVGSSTGGVTFGSELSFTTSSPGTIAAMSNCELWLKLDETSGSSLTDSSGNGRNGTATGAIPGTTTFKIGSAWYFDGVDDSIKCALVGSPTEYTLSGWSNNTGTDTSGATVLSLGDYAGILTWSNSLPTIKPRAFYYDGTTWKNFGSTTTHINTGWHHYVYVVSDTANTQDFYIDGVLATSTTHTIDTVWSGQGTQTCVGVHGNGSINVDYKGWLDDLRVFSRAITQQEVTDLVTIPVITGNGVASNITSSSALIYGSGSTNGSSSCNILVQYGTGTGNYTGTSSTNWNLTGSSSSSGANWSLSSLSPNTTYYYKLQINNSANTVSGTEQSFTTSQIDALPVVYTLAATSIGSTSAILNGSVAFNSSTGTAQINYGIESGVYGSSTTPRMTGVSSGLVGWWKMNEIIGSAVPDYAGSNPGTVTGAVVQNGKIYNSLYFDGVDDYVNIGDATIADFGTSTDATIMLWVNIAANTSNWDMPIAKKTGSYGWNFELGNGNWNFFLQSGTTSYSNSIFVGTGTAIWKHLSVVIDKINTAGTITAFVNGVQVDTDSVFIGSLENNDNLILGMNSGLNNYKLNGNIDDVRIYNRALSNAEVYQVFSEGSGTVGLSKTVTGLSEGTQYFFQASANNYLGTTTGSELNFQTTDATAPSGTISINGGSIGINNGSATVLFDATDNLGIIAYYLSGSSTTPSLGTSSWVPVGTSTNFVYEVPYNLTTGDGTKTVYGWVKDQYNVSATMSDTIIREANDPAIMIISPTTLSTYTIYESSVNLAGTSSDVAGAVNTGVGSVTWSNASTGETGGGNGTDTWTATVGLNRGSNIITVYATDEAANMASDVINVNYTGIALPSNHINYRGWYESTQGIAWLKSQGLWLSFLKNVRSTQDWQDLLADPSGYLSDME